MKQLVTLMSILLWFIALTPPVHAELEPRYTWEDFREVCRPRNSVYCLHELGQSFIDGSRDERAKIINGLRALREQEQAAARQAHKEEAERVAAREAERKRDVERERQIRLDNERLQLERQRTDTDQERLQVERDTLEEYRRRGGWSPTVCYYQGNVRRCY